MTQCRQLLVIELAATLALGASAMGKDQPVPRGESAIAAATASHWPTPMPDKWIVHYYNRVEQYRKENAALPKDRKNIVFVGDSLTEGFPLEEYFPGQPVLNRGIISDGIGFDERGVIGRLDSSVFDCNPKIVFILIGVNDLPHEWVSVKECLRGYRDMVKRIQKRLPEVKLVLCTLLPPGEQYKKRALLCPRIEEFNRGLAAFAKRKSLPLIDLHALYRGENGLLPNELTSDGMHLKKEAYARWAEKVKPFLD